MKNKKQTQTLKAKESIISHNNLGINKSSKRSFSTNKVLSKVSKHKTVDDTKQSNLLMNIKSINPVSNLVAVKDAKNGKNDLEENVDKFNRVFNANEKNCLINIIEDSESLMMNLQSIQNRLQDYKNDINSNSKVNDDNRMFQKNQVNINSNNTINNSKGLDYYYESIRNLSINDNNDELKMSKKQTYENNNPKTLVKVKSSSSSSSSSSNSSKFGESKNDYNKEDLKLPLITPNKSISMIENKNKTNTSSFETLNKNVKNKLDIVEEIKDEKYRINDNKNKKDVINNIVQEVKDQNKMNTLYPLKAHEQMMKYKNSSNKLFMNKEKNGKNKKKKKETFLTDIEALKKMEMNRLNSRKDIKINEEETILDSKSDIKEDDAFTQEYLKMHSQKNKDIFKYIDEETEIEKKYSKNEMNNILDELQLSSDENEDSTVKQGKKLLREIMESINTVKKLNKEKESELQAIIRITKDTSKNLDRHFSCINSIVKSKELGLDLNTSNDSDKNKKLGYDSIEENYSEEEEYERHEYRKNKQSIPYNINDDPIILKKNLNIIKGNLLSVTGGVIEFHQNFQTNYKNKMNEKNKNK